MKAIERYHLFILFLYPVFSLHRLIYRSGRHALPHLTDNSIKCQNIYSFAPFGEKFFLTLTPSYFRYRENSSESPL